MLKVSNLTKRYKKVLALDHFNYEFERGKIYGIVGPNGAGKTTLFKMLGGLVTPTEGQIIVSDGTSIEKYREKMSFIIETPYLYDGMTAMDNMRIIGGIKGETDITRLQELLALVKLDGTGKKKVKHFSLGMRQRLGIACALTAKPEILVLDEPMNGVDPEGIVELRGMLTKLCNENKITMLISSHILGELFQLSSEFLFINQGKMVKTITKKELENLSNGTVSLKTTDNDKALELIKQTYGDASVETGDGIILLKGIGDNDGTIPKLLLESGIAVLKYNTESLDLEQYYMKEIIGNENMQTDRG